MGIDGKKARWGLAVDAASDAHHLASELKLVLLASHVLDCRISKGEVERFIGKWQLTAGSHNVAESARLSRRLNVQDDHAFVPPDDGPQIVRPAYIQDRPAAAVICLKVPEPALAEKPPQRHLKLDGIHRLKHILKESARLVLARCLRLLYHGAGRQTLYHGAELQTS